MSNSYTNKEVVDRQATKKVKSKKKDASKGKVVKFFRQMINGEVLTKAFIVNNLPFLFFLSGLLVLLISKGYYSRQLSNQIEKNQKEIGEINSKLVSGKVRFNDLTDRVNMTEKLGEKKLSESESGIRVIRIDE